MKISKFLEHKLLEYSFLLFIVFDFLTKIFVVYNGKDSFFRFGALIKTIFIITIICIVLIDTNRRKEFLNSIFLKLAAVLSMVFIINQFLLYGRISYEEFNFNLNYFFRSIYPFLFLAFFVISVKKETTYRYIKIFQWIIVCNSILIFIGYFFDLNLLKTYFGSVRFGYQGVLLTHSESGYIYFIALGLGYYLYSRFRKIKNLFFLLIVVLSMLLIGTKKALFLLILFVLYIIFIYRRSLRMWVYLMLSTFVLFLLSLQNSFIEIMKEKYKVLVDVYHNYDILTAFFSLRNKTLTERAAPFIEEYWNSANFFFGGPVFNVFRVEMEVFDVFFFFGVLGILVYVLFFKLVFAYYSSKDGIVMTIGILLATLLSGNFFASINVFLLYLFLIKYYHYSQ